MTTDKVFQGCSHLRFIVHRIHNGLLAVLANIKLCHGTAAVTKDAIIVSRSIAKEGVGSSIFAPIMNIAGEEA
jgi:hypothetical protein